MSSNRAIAVIVAAGSGVRASSGYGIPKQYITIGEFPMLKYSLSAFYNHPEIDDIVVVIRPEDLDMYNQIASSFDILPPVIGGEQRQHSVYNALEAISSLNPDFVLIHDASRPFVTKKMITSVLHQLKSSVAVVPAVQANDTLKKCGDGNVLWTIDRADIWKSQTPQGFAFNKLFQLHKMYKDKAFSDDSLMFENAGIQVTIVPGSHSNIKITKDEDFEIAEQIAKMLFNSKNTMRNEFLTGIGFDVHAFDTKSNSTGSVLGGVFIPEMRPVFAHSDGDVVLHAITDAILGAIGMGDIGTHFSDTDPKWKDANSKTFLTFAIEKMYEMNCKLINVDITVICEEPKIATYRDDMCSSIAKCLLIQKSRVNIKGKTTEKLGFLGRKEGIAAQVVVSIEKTIEI